MSDDRPRAKEWSKEQHALMRAKLTDAANRLAFQMGARNVLVVAWFEDLVDPEVLHLQDGGSAPWAPERVYHTLAQMVDDGIAEQKRREETDEGDEHGLLTTNHGRHTRQ